MKAKKETQEMSKERYVELYGPLACRHSLPLDQCDECYTEEITRAAQFLEQLMLAYQNPEAARGWIKESLFAPRTKGVA